MRPAESEQRAAGREVRGGNRRAHEVGQLNSRARKITDLQGERNGTKRPFHQDCLIGNGLTRSLPLPVLTFVNFSVLSRQLSLQQLPGGTFWDVGHETD